MSRCSRCLTVSSLMFAVAVLLAGFSAAPALAIEYDGGVLTKIQEFPVGQPAVFSSNLTTTDYDNTLTFTGSAFSPAGAALQSGNTITRLAMDDLTPTGQGAGAQVSQFSFSITNLNSVTVTIRPRARFWFANGSGGAPGTYYNNPAAVGYSFSPITLNANTVNTFFATLTTGFNMPATTFWAGFTYDNNGGTTGATAAQLNLIGQGIFDPPTVGSSADQIFVTTAAGSFFGTNNPAGSLTNFSGAPLANFYWQFQTVATATGACCFPNGSCLVLTSADCATQGGSYAGDAISCAAAECPQPREACCFNDGSCVDALLGQCPAGSNPQGNGSTCATANCPDLTGACCYTDGSCADGTLDADCVASGGTFQGGGSDCASANCVNFHGACCFPNGQCADNTLEGGCVGAGGTFQGNGTDCASSSCPQPTEACCIVSTGACVDLLPGDCVAQGGIPQGPGSSCAGAACPPPPPRGACCTADGICVDGVLDGECAATGGVWYPNTPCAQVQCVNGVESKSWGELKGLYR